MYIINVCMYAVRVYMRMCRVCIIDALRTRNDNKGIDLIHEFSAHYLLSRFILNINYKYGIKRLSE